MSRSFRFVPPKPRPDLLTRPRLLRSLLGRWQHRVTVVTGGPGLGKTTLLAQAIAENRLAPRGDDVWIGIEEQDADADRLARVVATAVRNRDGDTGWDWRALSDTAVTDPGVVADVVWHRAPTEACLVFDDVHLLASGSTGATWLGDLVAALPANGHVVLASRSEPAIPLSRVGVEGAVLRLDEDDLRFSDEELSGFARRRGLDPRQFGQTGGWPAMAELTAAAPATAPAKPSSQAGAYLWEEVLGPLGTIRRHVLAVLSDLGGADDELASAAIGTPVDLGQALAGVPLVAVGAGGWHITHSLWRTAPGLDLAPQERSAVRRRAVDHLRRRGRHDDAFSLLQEVGLWDAAPAVLRSACLEIDRLVPNQLARWLAASSDPVRASLAGRLATGLHMTYTEPARAIEPLQDTVERARAEGDVDIELAAIAQLGQLAWWRQDLSVLADLGGRIIELEPTGHPVARALAAIARAMLADLDGDDATLVAELGGIESNALDTQWDISAGWLCGVVHLDMDQIDEATEIVDRLGPTADPAMRHIVDALRLRTWWRQGRVDEVLAELPSVIAAEERGGATYSLHLGQILGSVLFSHAGDAGTAQRYLDDALSTAPPPPAGRLSAQVASATASLLLTRGDEAAATATLRDALEAHGVDQGQDRRAWRQVLGLSYVLLPEIRSYWDRAALRGHLRVARDLAAAVVAVRGRQDDRHLRTVELPDLEVLRASLHHRLAAELAVGLTTAGRTEGPRLLEALGAPGRAAVRAMAGASSGSAGSSTAASGATAGAPNPATSTSGPATSLASVRRAKAARTLLAAVPAPPRRRTYLAVLGGHTLSRDGWDGEEVVDPQLRRTRLRELIAFLVGHRRTTRTAITGALWPDLDDRSAANNLGVTINHLLRLLEPWRDPGEPAYLLRLDGQTVQLLVGDHLAVDVDEFDRHLLTAAQAEADGAPSLALEHDLAAVALYRDQLHADLSEADWFALDREHYRTRFVGAAVRSGQLLLGRGDNEQAQAMAHRALAVDPWAEEAYTVLVGAALARHDRSGATRLLTRCLAALDDLGVSPSETTQQLRRRLQGATTSAA